MRTCYFRQGLFFAGSGHSHVLVQGRFTGPYPIGLKLCFQDQIFLQSGLFMFWQ